MDSAGMVVWRSTMRPKFITNMRIDFLRTVGVNDLPRIHTDVWKPCRKIIDTSSRLVSGVGSASVAMAETSTSNKMSLRNMHEMKGVIVVYNYIAYSDMLSKGLGLRQQRHRSPSSCLQSRTPNVVLRVRQSPGELICQDNGDSKTETSITVGRILLIGPPAGCRPRQWHAWRVQSKLGAYYWSASGLTLRLVHWNCSMLKGSN